MAGTILRAFHILSRLSLTLCTDDNGDDSYLVGEETEVQQLPRSHSKW